MNIEDESTSPQNFFVMTLPKKDKNILYRVSVKTVNGDVFDGNMESSLLDRIEKYSFVEIGSVLINTNHIVSIRKIEEII